jgi:3'-5' exoribonuclease
MWHDIGKVAEYDLLDDVTLDVKLAGHISFGVILLERACAKLNIDPRQEEVILLRHMILSHHDRKELGSPLCPQIPEAWALHMIDTSDSFFQMIYQQLRDVSQGEWGNPKDGLSSIFYHHSFLNLAEQNYFS